MSEDQSRAEPTRHKGSSSFAAAVCFTSLFIVIAVIPCRSSQAHAAGDTQDDVAAATSQEQHPEPTGEEALLEWWRQEGQRPVDYVVSKFDHAKWVFLGEFHRIRDDLLLVADLIPVLHRATEVRHLASEFLCRERTAEANRLVSGERFDRQAAIAFFRSQFPDWAYEEYLELFRVTWESNQAYAKERGPFRLVGLNPCVDHQVLNFGGRDAAERERQRLLSYDDFMAASLTDQLLEPGKPALIFTGIAHATAKFTEYLYGTKQPLPRMGNLVRQPPYADQMFFVALHAPFWDAGVERNIYPFDGVLDRLMLRYRGSVGFDTVGTPFEALSHENPSPRSITAYRFGELFDGYIMHATPLKELMGVTCIQDWVASEDEFHHVARNSGNRSAAETLLKMSLAEYLAWHCAPHSTFGILFHQRFRELPAVRLFPGVESTAPAELGATD